MNGNSRMLGTVAALIIAITSGNTPVVAQSESTRCAAPEYRQFDFWLGDWTVADPAGKPEGTNRVTLIQDGCVLQEHWRGTDGSTGTSFNVYNATTRRWHQTWVDNSGGLLLLDGGLSAGAMVLSENRRLRDGSTAIERITWSKLGPRKVRQLWERSKDSGKTWRVVFDGIYRR